MGDAIIAGNWKMNTTLEESVKLVEAMKPGLEATDGVQKVVCPPFTSLAAVGGMLEGSSIALGAQNMHHQDNGAFTGEISPAMLVGLCQFVILGHSERRHIFGETDDSIGRKVEAALKFGLRPILCVGERLQEREEGAAEEVVGRQVKLGLARIESIGELVVAYEPVWAIGTGAAATPDDAQAMMAYVRGLLATLYGEDAASATPLLYGGSVTADNVADFVRHRDVDGALVGGASLDAQGFVELVRNAASAVG